MDINHITYTCNLTVICILLLVSEAVPKTYIYHNLRFYVNYQSRVTISLYLLYIFLQATIAEVKFHCVRGPLSSAAI